MALFLHFSSGRIAANWKLNTLAVLRAAWIAKVTRFCPYSKEAGHRQRLNRMTISTLGGWLPEAHRTVLPLVSTIASRSMVTVASVRGILFQRHAAPATQRVYSHNGTFQSGASATLSQKKPNGSNTNCILNLVDQ